MTKLPSFYKVKKDSLDSIPSPSPSVKIQIVDGKGIKAKHCWMLSTNIWISTKSLLTMLSNVLPLHFKRTFPPIIWIFTEDEEIESRLPFKIFSTLPFLGEKILSPILDISRFNFSYHILFISNHYNRDILELQIVIILIKKSIL